MVSLTVLNKNSSLKKFVFGCLVSYQPYPFFCLLVLLTIWSLSDLSQEQGARTLLDSLGQGNQRLSSIGLNLKSFLFFHQFFSFKFLLNHLFFHSQSIYWVLTFVSYYSKHLKYISEQKEALTSAVGHTCGRCWDEEGKQPNELRRTGGGGRGAGACCSY